VTADDKWALMKAKYGLSDEQLELLMVFMKRKCLGICDEPKEETAPEKKD
jgi:hypothetical protein